MSVYVFEPEDDIDPSMGFDCREADALLRKLLMRAENALRRSPVEDPLREFCLTTLQLFRQTHESIRKLGRSVYEYDGSTGDALSLVREQIEKLFSLELIIDAPEKWIPVYYKDGWKRAYKRFCREANEVRNLPRFQEYVAEVGPSYFERLREFCGVTEKEKQNLQGIANFPTPGESKKHILDPQRKVFLEHWHVVYHDYCSFSHVLLAKVVLSKAQTDTTILDPIMRSEFMSKQLEPGLIYSYLAAGSAVAEINAEVGHDLETLETLEVFWSLFTTASLQAVALWNLRVKSLLPPAISVRQ